MAYSQAQIDSLQSAIASGRLRVEYPNGSVTYRSLDEMKEILRDMERSVSGTPATPNTIGIRSGKGL